MEGTTVYDLGMEVIDGKGALGRRRGEQLIVRELRQKSPCF